MEQIAQHLNISSGTLRTSFARYAGLAPKHWMAQHRVLLSIRMIRQGVSLNKITSALGYHDYPHMAKEFKSVVGHTPKQMETCLNLLQESGNTRQ